MKDKTNKAAQVVAPTPVEEPMEYPSYWRDELGIHDVLHDMTWIINDWKPGTLVTQAEYLAKIQEMNFTVH